MFREMQYLLSMLMPQRIVTISYIMESAVNNEISVNENSENQPPSISYNSLPFIVLGVTAEGVITFANSEALRTLGVESGLGYGRPIMDLLGCRAGADFKDLMKKIADGNSFDVAVVGENSKPAKANFNFQVIHPEESDFKGSQNTAYIIFGFKNKITEEKTYDLARYERNLARGEIIAEIAHELNNYLSIVLGNLELIEMLHANKEHRQVEKRVNSLKDGLKRIMDFSSGMTSIKREPLKFELADINKLISDELRYFEDLGRLEHVELIKNFNRELRPTLVSQSLLRQAIGNMIDNACDALKEVPAGAARMRIETDFLPGENIILIKISDSGPGMSAENYGRAGRQHFTTKQDGSGIGLLEVKHAVKIHGGRLKVYQCELGGACFDIELPQNRTKPSI